MSKKNRSFPSYISNNFVLKLISLVFAIILWSFVTNSTNPDRVKTLRDVPVVLQGLEALEEKGLTVRDDFEKIMPTVTVKVNVKNSDYKMVDKSVVFVSVDVSEIVKDGPNSVSVVPTFTNMVNVSLASVEPQAFNITVDKILEKEVDVSLNLTGELNKDLVSVEPQYDKKVKIKGSSYYVERISDAIVDIDLSTLKDGDIVSQNCRFTDSEGNAIKFNSTRITVDMDIQTKKEVSISTQNATINTDKVAKGYQFESISAGKIFISGHISDLQNITEIGIQPIDLKGKDATFTSAPVELTLPDGISVVKGQAEPQAKIQIVPQKKTVTVKRAITVSGLGENLTATITSGSQTVTAKGNGTIKINATVTLTGTEEALNNLTESDIIVRLSFDNTQKGSYEMTPIVSLSATIASNVSAHLVTPTHVSVSVN